MSVCYSWNGKITAPHFNELLLKITLAFINRLFFCSTGSLIDRNKIKETLIIKPWVPELEGILEMQSFIIAINFIRWASFFPLYNEEFRWISPVCKGASSRPLSSFKSYLGGFRVRIKWFMGARMGSYHLWAAED